MRTVVLKVPLFEKSNDGPRSRSRSIYFWLGLLYAQTSGQ